MKLKVFLTFIIAFFILLIVVRIAQFLVLKYFHWDFNLMETVMVPVTILASFVVGTLLASRRKADKS